MEALCVRAIRQVRWWDYDASRAPLGPSRSILRPENSVTWLEIYLSRWLVVQLNGRVLEFWDLENELQTEPGASLDGVEGIVSGGTIVYDGPDSSTLVISTRAIQIRRHNIAVARAHSLDIYDLDSIMSALSSEMSTGSTGTIKPFQTLTYPSAWTGSGIRFIPNSPPWLRTKSVHEGDIYLSLTEERMVSVGLVAHREEPEGAEGILYKFERPYYLFGLESYWTTAICWGKSARRVTSMLATPTRAILCNIAIPSDGDPLEDWYSYMDRIVVKWRIPYGENDFTRCLAFDEPTGMSVIAMASGRLWIADPNAIPMEFGDAFTPISSICPDPAWPSSHPTPWLRVNTKIRSWDEAFNGNPLWASSVEEYYPGKNRPDCYGGATWFVNEVLHIAGDRVIILGRHEGQGAHNVWMLTADATVESVKTHIETGGRINQLPKIKLAVDEVPARRYAVWRHRVEPSDELYL
ncbi:hypothetical protein FRC01_005317 [Tulasnella sp. 417]|nr:hypothetical protein FRC01_005317 [Tulasnella sp. 417]